MVYREKNKKIVITFEKRALSEKVTLNDLNNKRYCTKIVNDINELHNTQVFELLCFGTYPLISEANKKLNCLFNGITS